MSHSIEINDGNRHEYGGDCAVVDTVPAVHPRSGKPMARPTRSNVENADLFTLLSGDIIRKDDPTAEFNFTYWTDDKSEDSMRHGITLRAKKGFVPCEPKDWIISPLLREILNVDGAEIVVSGARSDRRMVLMYRTKERYEQEMKAERRMLDYIDNPKSQLASRLSDAAGNSGFETFVERDTEEIVGGVSQGKVKRR